MKYLRVSYVGAALLGIALLCAPAFGQARHHQFNVNFRNSGNSCADLEVKSDGAIAIAAEPFTVPTASLEVDATRRGVIRVHGADRSDFAIDACKVAVADDQGSAQQMLAAISVSRSAGRVSTMGPSGQNGQWDVYYIVHAPRNGSVDLTTVNGPIEVRDVNGTVKVRATNGPLSISNCAGQVDAHTTNGPISFSGSGGDVKLNASNGPISLKLAGDFWNGPGLEAVTSNGPVSVALSNTFRSGFRLESSGNVPMSCKADFCQNALADMGGDQRVLRLNGSSDTVRVSTHNGPVSIKGTNGIL